MTAKLKTIRQLEDMTQKLLPNPQKVKNQLSKIKEETGETVYNTYAMLHAEKEREKIITQDNESKDARLISAENLPTVRLDVRPLTSSGRVPSNNQNRSSLPPRPKTVQEEAPPSSDTSKERSDSAKSKDTWGKAFQKIKIVQSLSGGIQIESGRSSSRLRRRNPSYVSPEYAYIRPLKMDVRQKNFPEMQAKFWADKFKELLELWENEGPRRRRLRDILPDAPLNFQHNISNAAYRYNQFIKNYGAKYKWAFIRSNSPMADELDQTNYVPIRHSELATIQDEMNKRIRETELIIQRSQTILKEVNSLTTLKKKTYEPDV